MVAFRTASGEERTGTGGGAALAERLAASNIRYPNGTFLTKHVVTNIRVRVDVDAGTATATSYVTVLQATPNLPLQPIYAGRYEDEFGVVDGAWAFTRRVMIADLLGDLTQHVVSGGVPT